MTQATVVGLTVWGSVFMADWASVACQRQIRTKGTLLLTYWIFIWFTCVITIAMHCVLAEHPSWGSWPVRMGKMISKRTSLPVGDKRSLTGEGWVTEGFFDSNGSQEPTIHMKAIFLRGYCNMNFGRQDPVRIRHGVCSHALPMSENLNSKRMSTIFWKQY